MKSTFNSEDCVYLLKDLTGIIEFTSFEDKERLISNGVNYSEMITEEEQLSNEICMIFEDSLQNNASELAYYVGVVAEQIYKRGETNCIIVSLARAGSPIGALIKRYIEFKYNVKLPHYSISIIRGRGIDKNALNFILRKHPNGIINFVDAWTGKGSITRELQKAIIEYNNEYLTNISYDLAVLADPAHLSAIAGTRKDVCIPNACLNSTISGLVSRTILNKELISKTDFHGAVRYDKLKEIDVTNHFLNTIEAHFRIYQEIKPEQQSDSCVRELLERIRKDFPVADINKVKLSIGESSRALIRRKPYKLLIKNIENPNLAFVLHLAKIKNVEICIYDTMDYECITLLK